MCFHMDLRMISLVSVKSYMEIFIGIVLGL